MSRKLQRLSVDFRVAFVAGLILPVGGRGPYNSAYFVNQKTHRVICHKRRSDGSNDYEPWTGEDPGENPFDALGTKVGALVCNDSFTVSGSRPVKPLLGADVVCIPANHYERPNNFCLTGFVGPWGGSWVVFANSHPTGHGSFIVDRSGGIQAVQKATGQNAVKVVPFV